MNAASVSRTLRRLGFNPLGSGTPRKREGLRVTGTTTGRVWVTADLDSDRAACEMTMNVAKALAGAGYEVRNVENAVFVAGKKSK